MKERCWKQLKNQLCPRERWVKDSEHTKCQCCSKQFVTFLRRRHHCRFCGNLFCSECSDYFLNGNYLGEAKQKFVRHCQFCHKKIEKFIREWTKMPEIYEEKRSQNKIQEQISDEEQDEKQIDQFNLNRMFEEAQKSTSEHHLILSERQNKIILEASQFLCDKFSLDKDIWKMRLKDLAMRAIIQTKMEVLVSEGSQQSSMDIARRVRIRTIQTQGNKGVQAMVKGIVLEKNTATKSMQTHLSNPKVLIIQNSIDMDSLASFIKFDELIKNDKAIMKKILQKIVKLGPDIIFVENNVHVFVLQYLQGKKIVVVNKVKQKQIEMIKEVTGIKKTIKKLWMLEKYKHQCILGKCDKIYFKNARQGQMFMFMQATDLGIRTILLGQETEEQTANLKKSMQILMRLARQLQLEKQFIFVQKQLKDGFSKKEPIFPIIQDFSPEIYTNIDTFLINQEIRFSKIVYSMIKLSQSPKNFQQYAHKVGKTSYKQICGRIQFSQKKVYSPSDMTLGAYIILSAANFERTCKKCENSHKEQYYMDGFIISLETSKKVNSPKNQSSFIEIKDEQFTLQKLKNHLTKQKQVVVIQTYTECYVCGQMVGGEGIKVGKQFLSNSFHHILHNLMISYNLMIQQHHESGSQDDILSAYNKKISPRKMSMDRCQHYILTRIYQYSGIQIKINIEKARISYLNWIQTFQKQSYQHIRMKQNKFIKNYYETEISEKLKLIEKISLQLTSLPFPMTSSTMSLAMNPKVFQYYENCVKLKEILDKCKLELKDIESKSTEELEKIKHDWTILIRRILKVQSILQLVVVIIDEIQRNLRKKKSEDLSQGDSANQIEHTESIHVGDGQDASQFSSVILHNNPISETYLDEQTKQYLKRKSKKIFPRVQGIFLHFHTAYINDPVSLLACGMNSAEFKKAYEDESSVISQQIKFKMYCYKKLKTDWPLRAQTDKLYTEIMGQYIQKMEVIEIIAYYPRQFENLRKREGIDNQLYVRGLCTCKSWDSSGGKSNSLFAKAQNDLLVVKVINQKQFDEFLKFAKDYLNYVANRKKTDSDTLLAKIFGIYEVLAKGKPYKCIVMQNIFYGLQSITKVYDLKGSEVNRLSMPEGNKASTGQDSNFKIDKEGQPYILHSVQYGKMMSALEQDSKFLKQNSVIDYSLLVIESKNTLRLGIIDYMRPYQLIQKLQNIYKQFKSGRDPTVIPPSSYAERFVTAMKKYFLKIQ